MASENVKIVIKELNETTPKGAGESSDVVYIPGLAIDEAISEVTNADGSKEYTYAVANTPMLCKTVDEFEMYFGKTPYVFKDADIDDTLASKVGYLEGMMDISYIYAKELLNAGLSVYYENIVDTYKLDRGDNETYDDLLDDYNVAKNDYTTAKTARESADAIISSNGASNLSYDDRVKKALDAISKAQADLDKAVADGDEDAVELAKATLADAQAFYDAVTTVDSLESIETAKKAVYDAIRLQCEAAFGTTTNAAGETELCSQENPGEGALCSMGKIQYLYGVLADRLRVLEDKSEYSVKYITSGGYPTFTNYEDPANNTLADTMVSVAANRGDAVAIIDHGNSPELTLDPKDPRSIYYAVNKHKWTDGTFGAMFTPYARYSCVTMNDDVLTEDVNEALHIMPASFGYLKCLASAIKTSPNWLAMAGVTRGQVPHIQGLTTHQTLSNVIAEEYQPKFGSELNKISVNAITNVKPYGLTVWGNRTLEQVHHKGTTALNFLNTRNMVSDIKKLAYSTAQSLMFEQDSDMLWNKFKAMISPLLEQLKTGYGISNYKILRASTKINGDPLTRGEIAAVIRIYPLYAVEYFEITVAISEEE